MLTVALRWRRGGKFVHTPFSLRCNQANGRAGSVSQVHLVIYDFAEHVGDALAFTPPTVPVQAPQGGGAGAADFRGQPMYTRLKQSCMLRGDANSRWCGSAGSLRADVPTA